MTLAATSPQPKIGGISSHDVRRRLRDWTFTLLPCLALACAVALRASDPPVLQDLRFSVFDNLQRLNPRTYEPVPVTVVDLDDETLQRYGQWPWPRTLVARLIGRLQESGAAAIGLDIVFPEPDRTSPARVLSDWPDLPETLALRRLAESGSLPDHDRALAETLARGGVITGFALADHGSTQVAPLQLAGFASAGADPSSSLLAYDAVVPTLPEIAKAAAGSGSINVLPERDGIIRRIPLLLALNGKIYPSLAAEALRVAQGARTYIVKSAGASGVVSFGEQSGITEIKIGAAIVPTDAKARIWLYDSGPQEHRMLPAWQVLADGFDPNRVAGHITLIGTSAAGLKDLRATPLDRAAAGISVHAQLIEQMLLGTYLQRPDWATGAEILFVALLGAVVLVGYLFRSLGALSLATVTLTAIAAAIAASWYAFAQLHLLVDPIFPSVAVMIVYLTASLLRYWRSENERAQIRQAFGYYMAPALVERLAEKPELLRLGGEMRELTLLFCDVRGFTTISEQFNAGELTNFINRFLTPMTDIIMATEGTIDKYMGDCIMAMWNAPLDDADHAEHACRAALAMREGVEVLNQELLRESVSAGRPHIPVKVGIGLNSGTCCVGNMGSQQRFDYSALGDDVNLASRLEGQCKTYGVDIILGPHTRELAPKMAAVEIDLIQVKGKTRPVRIFALLGGPERAAAPGFAMASAIHDRMLVAYRAQDWEQTRVLIAECREAATGLGLSALYDLFEERISYFIEHPPGPDWDGAFVSLSK